MSNYKVTSAAKLKDRESQYGTMTDYMMMLTDEANAPAAAELSQKQSSPVPKAGDILSGTIEQTNYGPKFKKEKPSFGGAGVSPRDPEIQRYIMRQNALTTAANRGICKAQELCKFAKDKKEADKILDAELGGKHLIQVAGLLAKFSEGKIVVTMSEQEVLDIFVDKKEEIKPVEKEEVVTSDEEEIDISTFDNLA
jgi:hypothetical protein